MVGKSKINRTSATLVLATLLAATPSALIAQAKQQGKAAATNNTAALNAVKAALEKYKDPVAAVRDGYLSDPRLRGFSGRWLNGSRRHGLQARRHGRPFHQHGARWPEARFHEATGSTLRAGGR
jgi:ribonuclease HI